MPFASRRRTAEKDVRKISIILSFAFCLLLVSACTGGGRQRPGYAKPKIEYKHDLDTGAGKEIIRSEPRPLALSSTPKGRASAGMIEEGRRELAAGNAGQAERLFQDAINIDPGNGIAYYYLAKAKYELSMYQQALGVLDKAEELLAGSKEWTEAVHTLREMIKEKS